MMIARPPHRNGRSLVSGLAVIAFASVARATAATTTSAPAIPPTDEVIVSLRPEKTETEIGAPLLVDIVYRNVGRSTFTVEQDHSGTFHNSFIAADEKGRPLPNPYACAEPGSMNGPVSTHTLKPGGEVVITRMLNESVRFPRPGTYTIDARAVVSIADGSKSNAACRIPRTVAGTLKVKAFDQARRAAEIDALLAAYKARKIPADFPFANKHVFNGDCLGLVRLAAFFDDPRLVPFFLDVIEDNDANDYATCGLMALSDRARVLKAFEERLDQPRTHNVTRLTYPYARLKYPLPSWSEAPPALQQRAAVFRQRQAVYGQIRDRVVALLKADREYRYARLIPGLYDPRGEELFLAEYALHAKPPRDVLRGCVHLINRVELPSKDAPLLEPWLDIKNEWSLTDAAIRQLIRIDRAKYLPILRAERDAGTHHFSPEVYSLLGTSTSRAE